MADGSAQNNAFQGAATAEGHIELAVFESAGAEVNDYLIEGFALAFVDGDGPGEFERVLREGADGFGADAAAVVRFVADNFPGFEGHFDAAFFAIVFRDGDDDGIFFQLGNFTDGAIDVLAFGEVIFDKHHLSAEAQFEGRLDWIKGRVESAFHFCGIDKFFTVEAL